MKTPKPNDIIRAKKDGETIIARVATVTNGLLACTPCHRKGSIKRGYIVLNPLPLIDLRIIGKETPADYLKKILPKGLPS